MKKGLETLFSKYIIDGTTMDSTPADMLRECFYEEDWNLSFPSPDTDAKSRTTTEAKSRTDTDTELQTDTVIDETPDRDPAPLEYDPASPTTYMEPVRDLLSRIRDGRSPVSITHPWSSVRILIAETLLRFMWRPKPVSLDELNLSLEILWDTDPVGHAAAFFTAVESATGYIYDLGLHIKTLTFKNIHPNATPPAPNRTSLPAHEIDFHVTDGDAYGPHIPGTIVDDPDSILIYIPFDTCTHRLGGSLLAFALGTGDEGGPEISDPDYFIDSFEVVHDLVEDGIALSGVTVGRGGLISALDRILGEDWRIELDINGIQRAYMDTDPVRILYSEIPGALIQIGSSEQGYTDAQFLLQDIAYYPLGTPVRRPGSQNAKSTAGQNANPKITLAPGNGPGIARILSALISSQSSEDPDISNFSEGTEDRDAATSPKK